MSPRTGKITHVVASLNIKTGGPALSVSRLASELGRQGKLLELVSLDYPEHGPVMETPGISRSGIEAKILTRLTRGWSPSFRKIICRSALGSDLIHNHGIWMFPNHYAACAARSENKPLITSPRGMLGSWALSYHSWPKKILWHLREKHDLTSASGFHATSSQEAGDIRRAGFTQPIAIIPNGVDLPLLSSLDRSELERSLPQLQGKRLALFVSRIHPKKGLLELIDAWALLPPELRHVWVLLIAGPDLTNHLPQVEARIRAHGLENFIHLHPPVTGMLKQSLLEKAELFILPSHEENFGIVVAEALAHGTPVITTQGTPWSSLETNGCGWWIELSVKSLEKTLLTALSLSAEELSAKGQAGRLFAEKDLSWAAIARKMVLFYDWILDRGTCPDFVRLD